MGLHFNCSQQSGTSKGSLRNLVRIFNAPPHRKHCLSERPVTYSSSVKTKFLRQLVHTTRKDTTRLRHVKQIWQRIAQQRPRLINWLTDYTFRIDSQPWLPFGSQDVVMMEITVQQDRCSHRGAEFGIEGFCLREQGSRKGTCSTIVVFSQTSETTSPVDYRGKRMPCWHRSPQLSHHSGSSRSGCFIVL